MIKPLNGEELAKRETYMSLPGQSLAFFIASSCAPAIENVKVGSEKGDSR